MYYTTISEELVKNPSDINYYIIFFIKLPDKFFLDYFNLNYTKENDNMTIYIKAKYL